MFDKKPSGPVNRQAAPTNGWDSVFAINFNNANAALVTGWPQVDPGAKNVAVKASEDPSFDIEGGVLKPWQFTDGGDGKNVRMACTFEKGTYNAGSQKLDMTNAEVIVEIGMEWVPNPGQKAFVISDAATIKTIGADLDQNKIDAGLTNAFKDNKITLPSSATARVIQQGLEWKITISVSDGYYIFHTQDKDNDPFLMVYQYQKAWKNNLNVLAKQVSKLEPAVAIITIANNPAKGIAAAVLPQLLSEWFNTNIGQMNHVFAFLDLAPEIAKDEKFAWIKPTATSYAVVDQGSLDTSIFGVLTMNGGHAALDNHEVTPYAIPTGSDAKGSNAGFLISGTQFVNNMLLPGALQVFSDAPASAFMINNDQLGVTNTKEVIWGKFMMDNKKQGSVAAHDYSSSLDNKEIPRGLSFDLEQLGIVVSGLDVSVTTKGSQWLLSDGEEGSTEYILNLDGDNIDVYKATIIKIGKGGFTMSLNHSYVEIQFIDLKYPYSDDFDVHVNYTDRVVLQLMEKNGKKIFWFDQTYKNMVVNVTKTKEEITKEIVLGAVAGVLAMVAVAGPLFDGLTAGAEVTGVTEDAGEAVIAEEAFEDAEAANPQAAEENNAAAGADASAQSSGRLTNIKNAFNTPRWKFVGTLAALAGAAAGIEQTIAAITEAAAKKQWENVPGFDDFANEVIAPHSFPNITSFELESAWLADSLQIGLKTIEKS